MLAGHEPDFLHATSQTAMVAKTTTSKNVSSPRAALGPFPKETSHRVAVTGKIPSAWSGYQFMLEKSCRHFHLNGKIEDGRVDTGGSSSEATTSSRMKGQNEFYSPPLGHAIACAKIVPGLSHSKSSDECWRTNSEMQFAVSGLLI